MRLAPAVFVNVEELESLDGTVEHVHPAHVVHVVPLVLAIAKEDLEWLIKMNQVHRNSVSPALFVARVELAELLAPCLIRQVTSRDGLTCERVLDVGWVVELAGLDVLREQFARAVAQQLMQGNDERERLL